MVAQFVLPFLLMNNAIGGEMLSFGDEVKQLIEMEPSIQSDDQKKIDAYVDAAANRGFGYAQYMRALRLLSKSSTIDQRGLSDLSGAIEKGIVPAAYVASYYLYGDNNVAATDAVNLSTQALALIKREKRPELARAVALSGLQDKFRDEISDDSAENFYAAAAEGSAIASAYLLSLRNIDENSQAYLCSVLQHNKLIANFKRCDGVNLLDTDKDERLRRRIKVQFDAIKAQLGAKYAFYNSALCEPLRGSFEQSLICAEMLSAIRPFCELDVPSNDHSRGTSIVSVCSRQEVKGLSSVFLEGYRIYFSFDPYN